jgi:DNA-damage-inducible protein D
MNPKETQTNLPLFEDAAHDDGMRHWYSSEFMKFLGYSTYGTFAQVINKSMGVCASLGVDISEAFMPSNQRLEGKVVYKLNRFACFLIAMHADERKEEVKRARVYLAAFASSVIDASSSGEGFVRMEMRDELKDSEKTLSGVAQNAGLKSTEFGIFKDAGIRGMYNMSLSDLKKRKGFGTRGTLYDFMDRTELAGNFFRVTQTTERIRATNSRGLSKLTATAVQVGSEIRQMMIKNSGTAPESIPLVEDVNIVKRRLKTAHKEMCRLDTID